MNEERAGRPAADLFRHFNQLILIAYTLLILALAAFFGYLLERKFHEEIDVVRADLLRHGQFFEFVLRASADQLETLRMAVAAHYRELSDRPPLPPLAASSGRLPREDPDRGRFHLDNLIDLDAAGNLVGLGRLEGREPEFYRDLDAASWLNAEWSSLIFTLPHAAEARFISVHGLHAVLPWQPADEIPFDPAVFASALWTLGQPAANPDRLKYWAPVYFGGETQGLLAPVAVPLHDGERFVGVLAIDTSVDYLNRINADFNYPLGTAFLVDGWHRTLAHPQLYARPLEVRATPSLVSALPPRLVGKLDRLLASPTGEVLRLDGYVAIRFGLASAPWSLFYVVPETDLWWELAGDLGASMVGVLLGLALLMGLTYWLTAHEFVQPAASLVRHIAAEANFEAPAIPAVPTGWRPWFEAVTRAYRQSLQLTALRQELQIAARLQQAILPRQWPEDERYALWGAMRPAREIGGDFYDHFALDGGCRGMSVADVSGKGVSAGLFGMVSKTFLRSAAPAAEGAIGPMLAQVNDHLAAENDDCMFVTLFYARFDPARGDLDYVNAGHPAPLLVHADGRVEELPLTHGMALGYMDGLDYAAARMRLSPGDTLILFTDGVTEAIDAAVEEFGTARLRELFAGHPPAEPREAVERVFAAVDRFAAGLEQADDITCMALRYRGPSAMAIAESR